MAPHGGGGNRGCRIPANSRRMGRRARPEALIVGVDARDAEFDAWLATLPTSIVPRLSTTQDAGVPSRLYTDIGRAGNVDGPDVDLTEPLLESSVSLAVAASRHRRSQSWLPRVPRAPLLGPRCTEDVST